MATILNKINRLIFFLGLLIISVPVFNQEEIAQWRGPLRNGIYPDLNLKTKWPEAGLPVVLKIEGIGKGWSSAVVYNHVIYVSGLRDSMEVLSAYDMKGSRLWEKVYGNAWTASYPDSRNTPTVEGNRIYISSGVGEVVCLNAAKGDIIWKKNPHKEFKGIFDKWGMAESLLLTDKAVICSVGGTDASVVALNKNTGELIWKSPATGDTRAYVSPLMIERNGKKIILVLLSRNLLGINPLNGEILWTFDLIKDLTSPGNPMRHANTPLYKNGEIFITRGYDADAVMLSLSEDGRSVKLKWKNPVLDTHLGGVVEVNGFIYGSNWESNIKGRWACLEWNTGKVMFEQEWFNKGPVIYADGHLYFMDEKNGNLALALPDPSGLKIVSTFRVMDGTGLYWAHPTIYDGKLFIRHGDVLMIYDIQD
jgi:outer membrane protein assembly factor BamB